MGTCCPCCNKAAWRLPGLRVDVQREYSEDRTRDAWDCAASPTRKDAFIRAINSLLFQVDEVNIYLDGYEALPQGIDWQGVKPRIRAAKESPGIRDNGEFLALRDCGDCYFFTADDDIVYPPDYVERLIERIECYGRMAVVGIHGFLLPTFPVRFFGEGRQVFHFGEELLADCPVNGLGTRTVAFHSSLLADLCIEDFKDPGMTDVYLSVLCETRKIPMIAARRTARWLREVRSTDQTLYGEFRNGDRRQSEIVRSNVPWCREAIRETVEYVVDQSDCEHVRQAFYSLEKGRHVSSEGSVECTQ